VKIIATPFVVGAGVALASDDQTINVMLRPGEVHTVSDIMRSAKSIRHAITLGYITVQMDSNASDDYLGDHSDFVAQVELNALASMVSGLAIKYIFLDIFGGTVSAENDASSNVPYLSFPAGSNIGVGWTVAVPTNYPVGVPLNVEVFWTSSSNNPGTVQWRLEYKFIVPGGNIVVDPGAATYLQSSPGVAGVVATTGANLVIPSAPIGSLMDITLGRVGPDTFPDTARVHAVRIG
jgi:hypothetical protein